MVDVSKWRLHPQNAKTYVYIDDPETVLIGTTNQIFGLTDTNVEFKYDGTLGDYTAVKAGMTLVLLKSNGEPKAFLRVRGAPTADTMYIDERSFYDPLLSDNDPFKVINEYRIWTKTPRFDNEGVQYKDYDTPYTTQTTEYHPLANAGADYIAIADASGFGTVDFNGANSYAIANGASISSYAWNFADGTPSSSSSSTESGVVFPAGRRYVELTVTDSNAETHTARALVVVVDGTAAKATPAEITSYEMDIDFGTEIEFQAVADVPFTPLGGAKVLVWQEEYRNGTLESIGQGQADREHVKFVGYLEEDSITWQPRNTDYIATAYSPLGKLQRLTGLGQAVEDKDDPQTWFEMQDPTAWRVVDYMLRWHTTMLETHDVIRPNEYATHHAAYWNIPTADVYSQINELAEAMGVRFTSEKNGVVRFDYDLTMLDNAAREGSVDTILTFEDQDKAGAWTVERRHYNEVGWLWGKGLSGADGVDTPLFAIASGDAPSQGASQRTIERLLPNTQTQLNQWTGARFAYYNRKYQTITGVGAHSGMVLDPAIAGFYKIRLDRANKVDEDINGTTDVFMLRSVSVDFQRGFAEETYTFEEIPDGFPAATKLYTGVDPSTGFDVDYEYSLPPYTPSPVIETPDTGTGDNPDTPTGVAIAWNNPLYLTDTRQSPEWLLKHDPASELSQSVVVDEFSEFVTTSSGSLGIYHLTDGTFYHSENIRATTPTLTAKQSLANRTLARLLRGAAGQVVTYGKNGAGGANDWGHYFDFTVSSYGTWWQMNDGDGGYEASAGWKTSNNWFNGGKGTLLADLDDGTDFTLKKVVIFHIIYEPFTGTESTAYLRFDNQTPWSSEFLLTTGDFSGADTEWTGSKASNYTGGFTRQLYFRFADRETSNQAMYWTAIYIAGDGDDPFSGGPGGDDPTPTSNFYLDYLTDYGGTVNTQVVGDGTIASEGGMGADGFDNGIVLAIGGTQDTSAVFITPDGSYDGTPFLTDIGTIDTDAQYNVIHYPYREFGDNSLNNGTDEFDVLIGANGTDSNSQALWILSLGIDGSVNGTVVDCTPVINGTYYRVADGYGEQVDALISESAIVAGCFTPVNGDGTTRQLLNESVLVNGTDNWSIIGSVDANFARWSQTGNQGLWFTGTSGIWYTSDRGATPLVARVGDYFALEGTTEVRGVIPVG